MTVNLIGREIPAENAGRPLIPYRGVGAIEPSGRVVGPPVRSCRDYPADGNKLAQDLPTALKNAGLRDGMVVSTHHHLRDGDYVARQLFAAAELLGVRDLVWFPSAVFPSHAELLPYLENGTIHHIEGSLNGPVGSYASSGKMPGWAVLRSHGSRYRAIQEGEVRVDIAVIAAPSADPFGNLKGTEGPSACGGLGFALADAQYADHVIAVTDNLVPFPCAPWQIQGNHVDQVVVVDRIGDSSRIVSGTTELTRSPERLLIAEYAARFTLAAGLLRDGWSFQAGAGGISLAFTLFVRDLMRESGVQARFVRGGSTRYLVEMLETGLTGYILDGQTFDLEGVRSMRENPRHLMTSPFNSYNYHGKGNVASMLGCAVLGATEVDLDFNANVVSHSDGRMLHGIGGWQDALFAGCTILAVPTFRNRVPIVRDRLTTFCGPGELIDVIVTERGIAVNPRREDLLAAVAGKGLPIRPLSELKDEAEALCGGPPEPLALDGPVVGLVTWVDGTILDTLRRVP
ncbi:citrate lyase subunit alpha [Fimbriimonas ginsengisoli]|uniref:Citrate lyase, alpha subunit n=1 Tax=Fimbriimonas ginsengisoli Gsoil 348 TaxID=661478 RepID=A0A068NJX1_FIMGI|nr:citrate lyase subunit alpha [Fimbriimonas ginsengisoli]AIE83752.1 citrate lyase, alpha subunit [Fimbriimonas ginsengisoli Gsoil 348]